MKLFLHLHQNWIKCLSVTIGAEHPQRRLWFVAHTTSRRYSLFYFVSRPPPESILISVPQSFNLPSFSFSDPFLPVTPLLFVNLSVYTLCTVLHCCVCVCIEALLLCHMATAVGVILEFHLLCENNGYVSNNQTEKQIPNKVLLQCGCRSAE